MVLALVAVTACGGLAGERKIIGDEVDKAVATASFGAVIDIAQTVDVEWDYLHVLRPESSHDEAYELLGFRLPVEETGGGFFDHQYRLVFVAGTQVVAWSRLSTDTALLCNETQRLERSSATLVVLERRGGSRFLARPDVASDDQCDF